MFEEKGFPYRDKNYDLGINQWWFNVAWRELQLLTEEEEKNPKMYEEDPEKGEILEDAAMVLQVSSHSIMHYIGEC